MKWKENRTVSFLVVGAVYLISAVLGVSFYLFLPYAWWLNLLIADGYATIITFLFSVMLGNASVYDPYWSVQPMFILWVAALFHWPVTGFGCFLLIVVSLWGIRLTANWAYTFDGLNHQDWRYSMLKEKTGFLYPLVNFFGIHLVPTLVVYLCTLPAVVLLRNGEDGSFLGIGCLIVSLFATGLQGVSDVQMHCFRKEKRGGFIRDGFWKYSRHPNYLGEILMWWGIGLAGACRTNQWYLLAGAVANTLLFLCVSIPMAEKRQSRKEGFSEYKAQTRILLPCPPIRKK